MRRMLVFLLVVGLGCRLFVLGTGEQGVVGWIGAALVVLSLIGLGALAFRRDAKRFAGPWISLSSPYLRYGLLVVGIASLAAATLAGAGSVAAGIFSAVFWLCALGLVVHLVGGAVKRRQQRSVP